MKRRRFPFNDEQLQNTFEATASVDRRSRGTAHMIDRVANSYRTADVRKWRCAPKARIISGGRIHPESCRLIWKLTSGSAG